MENKKIILNSIKTPDGTIITSRHVHDYVTHTDKNGFTYMVDGGNEYLRRSLPPVKFTAWEKILKFFYFPVENRYQYEDLSLYEDSPFEEIRKHYCRGGRGKDGRQPLTWVPLKDMNDQWLAACIIYNEHLGLAEGFANKMYAKEQEYRKENNITIPE